jgi:hypothetical protein
MLSDPGRGRQSAGARNMAAAKLRNRVGNMSRLSVRPGFCEGTVPDPVSATIGTPNFGRCTGALSQLDFRVGQLCGVSFQLAISGGNRVGKQDAYPTF